MIFVKHRLNEIQDLRSLNQNYGVEIDLRIVDDRIMLSHDAFEKGIFFEEWMFYYRHKLLILNVKEDGLEAEIEKLLKQHGILKYFFLDQPFPTQKKCLENGLPVAFRFSELEPMPNHSVLQFSWLWVDNFTGNWEYILNELEKVQNQDFQICLVSPELQGRKIEKELIEILKLIKKFEIRIDAICTKFPEIWEMHLNV